MSLALKYRPHTFEGIVGQAAVSKLIQAMVVRGTVPAVLLLSGPRGSGKTSTARVLGAALNCHNPPAVPCGTCDSCVAVFEGTSSDYREIDAATHGRVEEIRRLQEEIVYQTPGKYRIVVIDEAHGLTTAASNALLKTLEESPEGVVFVLVSTEPDKILATIRSRCMSFQFRKVPPDVIAKRLYEVNSLESLGVDDLTLVAVADRSAGVLRDALVSLDQLSRSNILTFPEYEDLFGNPDFAPSLIAAMADGNYVMVFSLLDKQLSLTGDTSSVISALTLTIRDVMVIQGGGAVDLKATPLKERTALAKRIPPVRLISALRALWDVKVRLRATEDSLSSLNLVVSIMTAELSEVPVPDIESMAISITEKKSAK